MIWLHVTLNDDATVAIIMGALCALTAFAMWLMFRD